MVYPWAKKQWVQNRQSGESPGFDCLLKRLLCKLDENKTRKQFQTLSEAKPFQVSACFHVQSTKFPNQGYFLVWIVYS
jgi:hypothetical protein